MEHYDEPEIVNVGSSKDDSIEQIARIIQKITGFEGELVFDTAKPDGTMRKMLDVDKINELGWHPAIDLEEGIRSTYEDFVVNYEKYTR